MKMNQSVGLFAIGIALATTASWAQTTPTGTVSSTTYPQGAIAPDSMSSKAASRSQKKAMKQSRRLTNQKANANGTTNTSPQDARYRQSSASDGTTMNNSNLTNYNSNNATNAPTGAGSNPTTIGNTTSQPVRQATTSTANANVGAIEAVKGAQTSETPAVKAGSTVRNTSIGDFMASSPNYTTLQNVLQSSDLFDMLKGSGPYTLLAPMNNAFKKLPPAIQAGLLDGTNRAAVKQLLSYHLITGSLSRDELTRQIKAGNGQAQLKTMAGGIITARSGDNGQISLTDEQGGTIHIENTDYPQANGMVYGVDNVLMPKGGVSNFR